MTEQVALFTTREVAEFAHVHASTVRRWVADGVLRPAQVTPGGQRRFRREDVEALLTPKADRSVAS